MAEVKLEAIAAEKRVLASQAERIKIVAADEAQARQNWFD